MLGFACAICFILSSHFLPRPAAISKSRYKVNVSLASGYRKLSVCVDSPQISYCWDGLVPKRSVLQITALPSRSVCGFNGNEFLDSAMPQTRSASPIIPFFPPQYKYKGHVSPPRLAPLLILQFCFYYGFFHIRFQTSVAFLSF